MQRFRKAMAAAIAIAVLGSVSSAQDHRFQASLNFIMAYPQNDFKMNVDRTFYGLSGEFFYQFPKSAFSAGLILEYMNYGSETRTGPLSDDIPDVWVDVTTRNSILSLAAVLRLSPTGGPFRPYVEGLVGFNYLFTYTAINDDGDWSEDIATTTNFDDWALTYGLGAGAIVRALDVRSHEGRSIFSMYFEIGLRYLKGGTAEYLRERSILRDQGSLTYAPLMSSTDLVKSHFGVVFRF